MHSVEKAMPVTQNTGWIVSSCSDFLAITPCCNLVIDNQKQGFITQKSTVWNVLP